MKFPFKKSSGPKFDYSHMARRMNQELVRTFWIVESGNRDVLMESVNSLLNNGEGWELQGGISCTIMPCNKIYTQGLYKKEWKDKP